MMTWIMESILQLLLHDQSALVSQGLLSNLHLWKISTLLLPCLVMDSWQTISLFMPRKYLSIHYNAIIMNEASCNGKKLSIFYHGNRTWCLNSPGHYDPYPGHKADTVSTFWISILHSSTLDYWKIQDKTNNKIFNFVPLLIFPWKAQSVLYKKIGSTLKLLDLSSYYILTLIDDPESFLTLSTGVLLEYSEKQNNIPTHQH